MLILKAAALAIVVCVLVLCLKKDQPGFAFLLSLCGAAGLLWFAVQQLRPDVAVSATVQVQGMHGVTPYIGWGNAPMLGLASLLFGLSVFLRHRVMSLD